MFQLHCNNCFKSPKTHPKLNLLFAQCRHILCTTCAPPTSRDLKCPICRLKFKGVAITPQVPPKLANYFEDPARILQLHSKIIKFQADQRASLKRGRIVLEKQRQQLTKRRIDAIQHQEMKRVRFDQQQSSRERFHKQVPLLNESSSSDEVVWAPVTKRKRKPSVSSTASTDYGLDFDEIFDREMRKFRGL
ncbi:hypothetical protein KR018_004600, partial [Drosophila ironensis]